MVGNTARRCRKRESASAGTLILTESSSQRSDSDISGSTAWNMVCITVRMAAGNLRDVLLNRAGGVVLTPDAWGMLHSVLGLCHELNIEPVVHDRAVLDLPSITWPVRMGNTRQCKDALMAGEVVVVPGTQMTQGGASHQVVLSALGAPEITVVVFNQPQTGSLADALLKRRGESVKVGRQRHVCLVDVAHIEIANHAPLDDLVRAVMILNPARVVLVHGTRRGLNALRRQIKQAGFEGRG